MGLIIAPGSPPMSIVWRSSAWVTGCSRLKRITQVKLLTGLIMQIQKSVMMLGDSATILATPLMPRRLTYKKTQGSPYWPADHIRDDAIREERKIKPTCPYCISNAANSDTRASVVSQKRNTTNPATRLARGTSCRLTDQSHLIGTFGDKGSFWESLSMKKPHRLATGDSAGCHPSLIILIIFLALFSHNGAVVELLIEN